MLRFMIIIIEYLETTLFQSRYAKIDSNYHRLSYPMIIITHHKHNPQDTPLYFTEVDSGHLETVSGHIETP